MAEYVFRMGGNREVSFSAASDMSAWTYLIENHSVSRTHAVPGETLYRIDRVRVARPDQAAIDRQIRLMGAANSITTGR